MVAVIPFAARSADLEHEVLGEMLADEVISALSRTSYLNVISRLSTTVFRGRDTTLFEIGARLKADYVLSGTYRLAGDQLIVLGELADTKSGRVVWGGSLKGSLSGVVNGDDPLIDSVVAAISTAVVARELERAQSQALPTLESYALLIGAIGLMHRLSARSFERAREVLQALEERAPRHPIPHAWLAKWHVLRVQQGWSPDPKLEARHALDHTRRALDVDPNCSLALTMDGFVHVNLLKRLDLAQERYELALRVNPNESLAWLLKGTLHAFKGEGSNALEGTEQALRLSPLDPLRYFYESLAATAALSAGHYDDAIELAQSSLRANRTHTSTLRALAISQVLLGRLENARETVRELLKLEPTLTVRGYLERSPSTTFETGKVWSAALRAAGVPEG
jgi:TolB-like protein/tetratricopeptide (TPR) repeat protein